MSGLLIARRARAAAGVAVVLVAALAATAGAQRERPLVDSRTRADLLRELAQARRAFEASSSDATRRTVYAKLLFQAGEFWTARELMRPLAERRDAIDEALDLSARLEHLTGRYDVALSLYDRLIAARAGRTSAQVAAMVGKMFVHYQRDDFAAMASLPFPAGVQLPNVTLARQFDGRPYRPEWHSERRVTEVAFAALDPLPQFSIEVNGVPLGMIFDTGGDLLILDDEVAKALGVTSVATTMGTFGGGLQAEIGFGKVDRVKVGEVTLHDVPVMILASKRFTLDKRFPVSGVFGTALMRQFLGTVDYRNRKLVLRERTAVNAAAVRRELAGRIAAELPFALHATHLMYARGSLDGKHGLTFFLDSGLAMDAMFAAPEQTLRYAGIPIPATALPDRSVGGGGGTFPTGPFPIRSLGLGPLVQRDTKGQYGARPPESYWARGFIEDGLLSHGFLKRYASWTIDFDSMTCLFERP